MRRCWPGLQTFSVAGFKTKSYNYSTECSHKRLDTWNWRDLLAQLLHKTVCGRFPVAFHFPKKRVENGIEVRKWRRQTYLDRLLTHSFFTKQKEKQRGVMAVPALTRGSRQQQRSGNPRRRPQQLRPAQDGACNSGLENELPDNPPRHQITQNSVNVTGDENLEEQIVVPPETTNAVATARGQRKNIMDGLALFKFHIHHRVFPHTKFVAKKDPLNPNINDEKSEIFFFYFKDIKDDDTNGKKLALAKWETYYGYVKEIMREKRNSAIRALKEGYISKQTPPTTMFDQFVLTHRY